MNILHKRPLTATITVALGVFLLSAFLPFLAGCIVAGVFLLFSVLFLVLSGRASVFRFTSVLMLVATLSACLSSLYFGIWFRADKRFSGMVSVHACITEIYYDDGFFTYAEAKAYSVNGESFSSYKMHLSAEDGRLSGFRVGDAFRADVTIEDTGLSDADYLLQYAGRGISLTGVVDGSVRATEGGSVLRRFLSDTKKNFVSYCKSTAGEDTGGLLSALLIGERSSLSPSLALDFRRIGISHILALSGLHLSVLSYALSLLLSALRVGKTGRLALLCPFVAAYILLTGAPSSILRAGFMIMLYALLFLCREPSDPPTSLAVSVLLICFIHPYAVFDIGLWLSALSTFGLLASGMFRPAGAEEERPKKHRLLSALLTPFFVSAFAIGASLLLSVLSFSGLSLLSAFSTLLFGFLTQAFMYIGILTLVFGGFSPLAVLSEMLYRVTERLAAFFSDGKYVYTNTTFTAVRVAAVLFTVLLVAFLILRIRRRKTALAVIGAAFLSVFVISACLTYHTAGQTDGRYFYTGKTEYIYITDDGMSALIDFGRGGKQAGADMIASVENRHGVFLDAYILTGYGTFSSQTVRTVLESIRCERIYLPVPLTEWETTLFENILHICKNFRTEVVYYSEGDTLTFGHMYAAVPYRSSDKKTSVFYMEIRTPDTSVLYLGRGVLTDKTEAAVAEATASCDTVILGGSGHASKNMFSAFSENVRTLIISDTGMKADAETLLHYRENGTEVIYFPAEKKIIR